MTKTLEQFKNDTLGNAYGNPGTGTYVGQCVSYVRLYMEEVLGIKTKVWGNAVDYWNNPDVLQYFDKVPDGRDGDIMVWGDDPGTWTGPEGHIAIKYGNLILNQNFGGSLRVSLNLPFTPGFLGYLRPKGVDMPSVVDTNVLRIVHSEEEGWPLVETHEGKFDALFHASWDGTETNDFVMRKWTSNAPWRAKREAALSFYDQYINVIGELSARPTQAEYQDALDKLKKASDDVKEANDKLANSPTGAQIDQVTKDQIKQTSEDVGWLRKLLNKIFNVGA